MREGLDRGADHTRDKDLCLSAGFANRKGKSLETELGNELRTRDMGKLTTRGCAKRMIAEVDKSLLLHFLKSRSRSLEPSNAGRFLCPMFFPVVEIDSGNKVSLPVIGGCTRPLISHFG